MGFDAKSHHVRGAWEADLRTSIAAKDLLIRCARMSSELFTLMSHCKPSSTTLPACKHQGSAFTACKVLENSKSIQSAQVVADGRRWSLHICHVYSLISMT